MWNCHVDEYAKGRYDIILVRHILTYSGLNIKLYDKFIEEAGGYFKGSMAPMVDLGTY